MTATTSTIDIRRGERAVRRVRRMAMAARSLAGGIGARWNAFVESGQLGPDREQAISRHTGGRI